MEGKMENLKIKKFKIERTRTGLPARWECGGGATNTGEVIIVAGKDGSAKKALYVRKKGHLANAEHALIPITVGDYIVYAYHKRRNFWIRIFRTQSFEETYAITELIYEFSGGLWNEPLPEFLKAAVQAAVEKATCYHCRSAHFVAE